MKTGAQAEKETMQKRKGKHQKIQEKTTNKTKQKKEQRIGA